MSDSKATLIEVSGYSSSTDRDEALRDALTDALKALIAAGCGPQSIEAVAWEVDDLAAFHPSRHDVELLYREVFAGFRKPVTLRRSGKPGLRVVITAAKSPPPADADQAVYRGYTRAELGRQYSPRGQTDMNVLFKQWSKDGAQARAPHGGLDLCYGPGRYETFDLFMPPNVARPPVWVFLHGGYWQASDKNQHGQFAAGMLKAGYAVVMANYGLAPETSVTTIVGQIKRLMANLAEQAGNLSLDMNDLHLSGHSAGAHLAAMAALDQTAVPIRSVLLLSGLFDLEPLGLLPFGRLLQFDAATIAALSPARFAAPSATRVALAVGVAESDEFKRQSEMMASLWKAPPSLIVPGHHFSMLEGLNGGALLDLALPLMRKG